MGAVLPLDVKASDIDVLLETNPDGKVDLFLFGPQSVILWHTATNRCDVGHQRSCSDELEGRSRQRGLPSTNVEALFGQYFV